MALIADLCPNCRRVTRCHTVESGGVVGGLLFGIPFVLPTSSVSCRCGECGFDFRSEYWDHQKTVSPDEAGLLDTEALLELTNPRLQESLTLAELKTDPRLGGAFALLDQLAPGGLRTGLTETLKQWARLDDAQRERVLRKVHDCSEALRFARSIAGRYRAGVAGCLAGAVACAVVWTVCLLVTGTQLGLWGWVGLVTMGAISGGIVTQLLWGRRDRHWVKEVLVPEARQSGVGLGWLLTALENSAPRKGVDDELRGLHQTAQSLRAELASSGELDDESAHFFFGPMK
jgi:hypothetical protein